MNRGKGQCCRNRSGYWKCEACPEWRTSLASSPSMLKESCDMGTSGVRSSGLQDASARCLAVEPTADVRDRILVEASVKAAGDVADMRRCQQVRQRAERMVERQRLLVKDIDGCASDLFVFERRNEIGLDQDRSPRRV